jgi:hypothetical protein
MVEAPQTLRRVLVDIARKALRKQYRTVARGALPGHILVLLSRLSRNSRARK